MYKQIAMLKLSVMFVKQIAILKMGVK